MEEECDGDPVLGILMLQSQFPRPLGDIGNPKTWPFPVRYRVVAGASPDRVVRRNDRDLLPNFIAAAKDLVDDGVAGITTSCGFLSLFQSELADAIRVPVATSSLLQGPLIAALLPKGQRLVILTISDTTLGPDHLRAVGLAPETLVCGVRPGCHFQTAVLDDQPHLDVSVACADITSAAMEIVSRHTDVGAVLLECTNMAPYAAQVRAATGIPVYSSVDFVNWFYSGLVEKARKVC